MLTLPMSSPVSLPPAESVSTLGALLEIIADPERARKFLEQLKTQTDELSKLHDRVQAMRAEFDTQQRQTQGQQEASRREINNGVAENARRAKELTRKTDEVAAREKTVEEQQTLLQRRNDALNKLEQTVRQQQEMAHRREQALSQQAQELEQKSRAVEQRVAAIEAREAKLRAALA